MITGKSGTGRSSLANYVLTQYCLLSKIPFDNLIVPKREYEGHDKGYTLRQWFNYLRTEINKRKIGLGQETKDDLTRYLANKDEFSLEPNFQDIANRISEEILTETRPHKFACCIEDVEDFSIVDAALSIFAGVPTLCIFTVKDYPDQQEIIAPFREKCKKLTGSALLELSPLSGHEVSKLVEDIWTKSSELKNPFDLACIEKVFKKPRSIGLALTIMANLIDDKLANHPEGAAWPHAPELAFTCDYLKRLVPKLEQRV
jgi:hypothetical protein